jgi:hypothetical protein
MPGAFSLHCHIPGDHSRFSISALGDAPVLGPSGKLSIAGIGSKKFAQQVPRLKSIPDGALCSVLPVDTCIWKPKWEHKSAPGNTMEAAAVTEVSRVRLILSNAWIRPQKEEFSENGK